MAQPTIINKFGNMVGWNSVTFNWLDRDVEGVTSIEYDDEQEMENIKGAGGYAVGQGAGDYSAKASVTLYLEEIRAMEKQLAKGKRLQDIVIPSVQVQYEQGGVIVTDVLKNVRIKNRGVAVSNNDKSISFKHDLLVTHIEWDVNR
jgi:hypothetical protein